ncbi:lysine--tRNA ligase, partial [Candidatus Berkelbacteria bacterium CG03_land_8_20_14_0_80_40_36]
FLAELAVVFESRKNWTGDALHTQIHKIKDKVQIAPKLAFSAIYQIFLGRYSGPQAGWFLASLDRKFVERRLRKIAE